MFRNPIVGIFCFLSVLIVSAQHEAEFFAKADMFFIPMLARVKSIMNRLLKIRHPLMNYWTLSRK